MEVVEAVPRAGIEVEADLTEVVEEAVTVAMVAASPS